MVAGSSPAGGVLFNLFCRMSSTLSCVQPFCGAKVNMCFDSRAEARIGRLYCRTENSLCSCRERGRRSYAPYACKSMVVEQWLLPWATGRRSRIGRFHCRTENSLCSCCKGRRRSHAPYGCGLMVGEQWLLSWVTGRRPNFEATWHASDVAIDPTAAAADVRSLTVSPAV